MPKEGYRTDNGYVWRNGVWVKSPGFRRVRTPPSRVFGERRGEGIAQDVAPGMVGEVDINVFEVRDDGSRVLVDRHNEKNLIVEKAPYIMANCLGGVSHPDFTIGGVQWGTGGHVSGDPNTPIPPDPADLALDEFVLETSIAAQSVGDTYIQFESEIGMAQGNGNIFTEAGLVVTGTSKLMFARKTFPGITKTSNRIISVRWIISFLQSTTGSDCQGVGLFGQLSPIRSWRYVVPAVPASWTEITVPLTWPAGLNRLWVWRNGKRVFNGDAYTEMHPTGIVSISPPLAVGEVWTFEVLE